MAIKSKSEPQAMSASKKRNSGSLYLQKLVDGFNLFEKY